MTKHFSKTLTRFISLSHKNMSSNSTDLSASPLLHPTPQPQISTSLAIQSVTPPTKKKESASFWFFAGVLTLGLGGANMLKHALVNYKCTEDRRKDLKVEPMKLNTTQDVDTLGHRRVVCKGVFDKQRSIYVGPKPRSVDERSEDGFYVITPLLPIPNEPDSMKAPILVNRGWVPLDWEETSLESMDVDVVLATANESRKANKLLSSLNPLSKFLYRFTKSITSQDQDPTTTHVEVVGVVRNNEFPSLYNVINYRRSLVWFFLDIPKLAQAMGFGEDTIYVEETPKDMDESRPYPVPRDLRVMLRTERKPLTYYPTSMLW